MKIPGPNLAQQARFAASVEAIGVRGPIILAVSGGPDSLALLLLAAATRHSAIFAATIDHGLRREGAAEAEYVHDLCRRFDVHHRILQVKVEDDPAGLQAAAREERYKALIWYADRRGAGAIATAHHVDDQAETVMMRIARGSGVAGLAGVRERRALTDRIDVVRPLLNWQRSELAAIVAAARIDPVDDPSNHDMRFDRARVRKFLAQGWPEPGRLAMVSRHMRDADDALEWSAAQLFEQRFARDGETATLDIQGLPREYLRRLVILAIALLTSASGEPRGDEIGRLIDRLEAGHVSTLGTLQVTPGPIWRFQGVAPHRSIPE